MEAIAQECLKRAESDSMTFPQVVSTLMGAGFEGYSVDFRKGVGSASSSRGPNPLCRWPQTSMRPLSKKRFAKLKLSFPVTPIRDLSIRSPEPDAPAI